MNEYLAHTSTCILYDDRVLKADNHDCCNIVGYKSPTYLGNFDIISLNYKVILPHLYDVNKLLLKVNVEIDDANTRKHIITVKTCINMKKISDNEYEKDLPIYEANIKILVPLVKGE